MEMGVGGVIIMLLWIIYTQSKEVIRVVVLLVNLYSMTRSLEHMVFKTSLVTGILPTVR